MDTARDQTSDATAAQRLTVPAAVVRTTSAATRHDILHLENLGDELRIYWRDGHSSEFLALWLRDNAARASGRALGPVPGTDPGYLPDTLGIGDAELDEAGDLVLRFSPEDITCRFDTDWLRRHGKVDPIAAPDLRESWDANLEGRVPRAAFRDLCADDDVLSGWLEGIRVFGIGLMRGLPPTSGAMLRVIERFGFPRRIESGACFAPDESTLGRGRQDQGARGLHTAAPYREPVPTLRALHCLSPAPLGGESTLVDGLRAAQLMARHHPAYFALLKQYTVPFERDDQHFHMRLRRPLVSGDHARPVRSIHYDPLHTAPLDLAVSEMRDFYSAYCCFSRTLNRIDLRLRMQLQSGDMLVLDNRRVLHGVGACQGERVLESCYADWDGLDSRSSPPCRQRRVDAARMTPDLPWHRDGAADADREP